MLRFYVWWNGMARQGRTGWTLVTIGVLYVLYFFKVRLFDVGPPIYNREWFTFGGMIVSIMLGTINIRMAEMKARNQQTLPLIDPSRRRRK